MIIGPRIEIGNHSTLQGQHQFLETVVELTEEILTDVMAWNSFLETAAVAAKMENVAVEAMWEVYLQKSITKRGFLQELQLPLGSGENLLRFTGHPE